MSKILIVEHEPQSRRRYQLELEREGYKVVTAETDGEGLHLVESASPDLVVLEAHIPNMEAMQTLVRLLDRRPRIPILMVSASWSDDDAGLREAADGYVMTSSDTRPLRTKVRQLLNPHAA